MSNIPSTMKAVVLRQFGEPQLAFQLDNIDTPKAGAGQILVQVEAFGLNFADVLARNGLYRETPPLPCVLGYDMCGRVVAVGNGVAESWIGKRVAGLTRFGSYAEYVVSTEHGCVEIPDTMPAAEACALGTQFATAYYSSMYVQQVQAGERVLVHAAMGGVGTALVQLLQHRGCIVYATAGSDEKVNQLRALGVTAFNYNTEDYSIALKNALQGETLDVSFNSIAGTTFKKDMALLGANGRLILYGFAERSGARGGKWATIKLLWNMGLMMPIMLLATSKSIIGVNMLKVADHRPQVIGHCLKALVELWEKKIIRPQIYGEYTVDQINDAHQALENRKTTGKLVVRW